MAFNRISDQRSQLYVDKIYNYKKNLRSREKLIND